MPAVEEHKTAKAPPVDFTGIAHPFAIGRKRWDKGVPPTSTPTNTCRNDLGQRRATRNAEERTEIENKSRVMIT